MFHYFAKKWEVWDGSEIVRVFRVQAWLPEDGWWQLEWKEREEGISDVRDEWGETEETSFCKNGVDGVQQASGELNARENFGKVRFG